MGLQTFKCPTCGDERGFLVECYEWYGTVETCLACGDSWQDAELLERPFKPRWRQERIEAAMQRIEAGR